MDKPTIQVINISKLKNMCQEYIDSLDKDGYVDDDLEHYIFECALEAFFGEDVWEFVNSKLD